MDNEKAFYEREIADLFRRWPIYVITPQDSAREITINIIHTQYRESGHTDISRADIAAEFNRNQSAPPERRDPAYAAFVGIYNAITAGQRTDKPFFMYGKQLHVKTDSQGELNFAAYAPYYNAFGKDVLNYYAFAKEFGFYLANSFLSEGSFERPLETALFVDRLAHRYGIHVRPQDVTVFGERATQLFACALTARRKNTDPKRLAEFTRDFFAARLHPHHLLAGFLDKHADTLPELVPLNIRPLMQRCFEIASAQLDQEHRNEAYYARMRRVFPEAVNQKAARLYRLAADHIAFFRGIGALRRMLILEGRTVPTRLRTYATAVRGEIRRLWRGEDSGPSA